MAIEEKPCNCGKPDGIHESWCCSNDLGYTPEQFEYAASLAYNSVFGKTLKRVIENDKLLGGPLDNLKKAMNKHFIGIFSSMIIHPEYSLKGHVQVRITIVCRVEYEYEFKGTHNTTSTDYVYRFIEPLEVLKNEVYCENLANSINQKFLKYIPELNKSVKDHQGRLISATFKPVE